MTVAHFPLAPVGGTMLPPRANPEKRHAGLENLETLAALSQELSNLLFWRALRGIVPR